jgi:hypothetical protein
VSQASGAEPVGCGHGSQTGKKEGSEHRPVESPVKRSFDHLYGWSKLCRGLTGLVIGGRWGERSLLQVAGAAGKLDYRKRVVRRRL